MANINTNINHCEVCMEPTANIGKNKKISCPYCNYVSCLSCLFLETTNLNCIRCTRIILEFTDLKSESSVELKSESSDELKSEASDEYLFERQEVLYTHDEELDIEDDRTSILAQIRKNERKNPIFNNQEECSLSIVSKFCNKKIINVMVVAPTQSGKTGAMASLIKNYLSLNKIPTQNIFVVTALSSLQWKDQTINRMPKNIKERIFHGGNLNNFFDEIRNKKNILIIIDEIQIAAKKNQKLEKNFKKIGFYDKQYLFKNDIKIVEFTATPDGTIYDLMDWKENASKIKMEPGDFYTSSYNLLEENRVRQYKDLYCYTKNIEIGEFVFNEEKLTKNMNELIEDINKFESPMYHIIRVPNGDMSIKVIENFKKYYDEELLHYNFFQDSEIEEINSILINEPEKHAFIFIKEKMRCSKTLEQKYLGVVYERKSKNVDDSTIIQGLLGRITGYKNNGKSICYTNIESIIKYRKLWKSDFDCKKVKWNSKTTKRKGEVLVSKGTYNVPPTDGISNESSEYDMEEWYHEWKEFSYSMLTGEHTNENLIAEVNNWIKEKPNYEGTLRSKKGNKFKLKENNSIILNGEKFYKSSYTGSPEILKYLEIRNLVNSIDNGKTKKTTNLSKKQYSCRTYVTYKDENDCNSITIITRYLERI